MRSRILAGYLGLVVVVLAALEIPLGVQFGRNEQRTLETKVEHDATTIASIAPETLRRPTRRRLQAIAAATGPAATPAVGSFVIAKASP